MSLALVAPSAVPAGIGGAERLVWGLHRYLVEAMGETADLIRLPSPEHDLAGLVASYRRFHALDLDHFDRVLTMKYPAWMVRHPAHTCYLLHRLRGLYDTWHLVVPHLVSQNGPELASHPRINALRRLLDRPPSADRVAEVLDAADEMLADSTVPGEALAFPGPLARDLVHYLDDAALAMPATARHLAISRTVAERDGYFPSGASVEVQHPPTPLEDRLREGAYDYLFTVSRLDGPKRIDLLIEAVRRTSGSVPLRIAGDGPESARLRELADGDPRIEFLGAVDDAHLVDLYADARAVLFAPYDEDFGLVALEAMRCAKPVITTTDAGGPLELVEHGIHGLVTDPSADALAEQIQALCDSTETCRELGRAARERVDPIRWSHFAHALLGEARGSRRPTRRRRGRGRLVVATTFSIWPPRGGGQLRVYHLYRNLARHCDIDIVSLAHSSAPPLERRLGDGIREIRVPKTTEHEQAEADLSREVGWIPVTDVALPKLHVLTPAYQQTLERHLARADVAIACHPYVVPSIRAVSGDDLPLWYEAQDHEVPLKRSIFEGHGDTAELLLELTAEVEHRSCLESELVYACSDGDAAALRAHYPVDEDDLVVVPNGVDIDATPFTTPRQRRETRERLGLDATPIAIFLGSWHEPNIDAARWLFSFANAWPEMRVLIAGSVCGAVQDDDRPSNVALLGYIDEATKRSLFEMASVALVPMRLGSGTNLKVVELCAAGVPLVSTPHGIRGLDLRPGVDLAVAELDEFETATRDVLSDEDAATRRSASARHRVAERYDWGRIADDFFHHHAAARLLRSQPS